MTCRSPCPASSVTQAADDLKARDALLRSFPEVESVVGKAGRAETATDPAPLDMVETFVNFRPRELWPKRVIRYADAAAQTRRVLAALEDRGIRRAGGRRGSRHARQRRGPEGAGAVRRGHARTGARDGIRSSSGNSPRSWLGSLSPRPSVTRGPAIISARYLMRPRLWRVLSRLLPTTPGGWP